LRRHAQGRSERCTVVMFISLARGQVGHRGENRPCTVWPTHGAISYCDQRSRRPWEIWLTLAGYSRPSVPSLECSSNVAQRSC
jgi:hypothetical protein